MKTECKFCKCWMGGDDPFDEDISHAVCPRCKPIWVAMGNEQEIAFADPDNKYNKGIMDPNIIDREAWPDLIFYQRSLGRSVIEVILKLSFK